MTEIKLTHDELEDMLDRAARRGAKEALRSIYSWCSVDDIE
jgi:hypothetical protein